MGGDLFHAEGFPDSRHMKVVSVSALATGRLYPKEIFLVLIIVERRPGRIRSMIISKDTIGDRTHCRLLQCPNKLRHCVPPCLRMMGGYVSFPSFDLMARNGTGSPWHFLWPNGFTFRLVRSDLDWRVLLDRRTEHGRGRAAGKHKNFVFLFVLGLALKCFLYGLCCRP